MHKSLVAGVALSACLGVLASLGVASASTLEVDGGILHHWELPAEVQLASAPTPPAEPATLQAPAALAESGSADATSAEPTPTPPAEPGAPVEPPADDAAVTATPEASG